MTEGFDYRKELLELKEWWEKVHPSTKADLLRVASGETGPVSTPPPPPSDSAGEDARGIEDSRKQIDDLLWAAKKAVEQAVLLELGLERRVGEFIDKGHKFEELESGLWRPLSMTKRCGRDVETDLHHLRTFLQELDWAIDPNPDFLPQHLERARIAGNKDNVAMVAEAMEMRKAWVEATKPKDPGT